MLLEGCTEGGIGMYMRRAVRCHERTTHAFWSQRNARGEHHTPEHAAQVTATVTSLEVQWPIVGTVHATGGYSEGWDWGVYACCVVP